ncbi:MAG TPA: 4-alpha-glucanotransferase, partial [Planctomycetaceae bacterium]
RKAAGGAECVVRLEDGGERRWSFRLDDLPDDETAKVERVAYVRKRLVLPERVPHGYHRLTLELPTGRAETLLIAAPTRAFSPRGRGWERTWGVFLPLYSLRSERSWGAGDFADFERLIDWTAGLGGGLVGTLPLLAAFLDEPYEISPYSPVSRLFWNEFYVSVDDVPEVSASPAARALRESGEVAAELDALRSASLVDYRRLAALKRRVLEEAARAFFAGPSDRRADFERYVAQTPHLEDYAAFRAVGERLRTPWTEWPTPLRDGAIGASDCDEEARRYHLYVQWLADGQLKAVSEKARAAGHGLYLDLPLGVDARGYDVWREREAFAVGVAGGAPPDPGFPKGQNWGFVPLHPEGVRDAGYRYVRAYLRHQLRHAGVLRIDHMPSFHRVYWIPPGADAAGGVYVRYPADELYAVFSLESHRHRTLLVGEDLGTVPPEVPRAMARHNFHRMYVVEYEAKPAPDVALPDPPAGSLACVNTHDMPPFASYVAGKDIGERVGLGLLEADAAAGEERSRREIRDALARFLAA